MSAYVPKILLCGDRAEFYAEIGTRPVKIVGQIEFYQDKFSIDGEIKNYTELQKTLRGGAVDYLIFNNFERYMNVRGLLFRFGLTFAQVLSLDQFKALPADNFFDINSDVRLTDFLKTANIKTLLDFDGHLAKINLFSKGANDFTEIDCVCAKKLLPIYENVYSRVYEKFADCRFKHYDAILIEERTPAEFTRACVALKDSAGIIITFARSGFELSNYLYSTPELFFKLAVLKSYAGEWFFCHLHKPPDDVAMYVVTHKKLPAEIVENLPEGYKLIHAGRAISADLGYAGDNTGENISHLNPYINEITALYWMWKNTSHTMIGLSHYRRFFTAADSENFAYEKILPVAEMTKILGGCDIALVYHRDNVLQMENLIIACGKSLVDITESILKKHLTRLYPDYLDTLDLLLDTQIFYKCNMFFTRKFVFDAYCKWLFSFFIDAVEEVLQTTQLSSLKGAKKRIMGYWAERMMTVFAMKNRLRIKELSIMEQLKL